MSNNHFDNNHPDGIICNNQNCLKCMNYHNTIQFYNNFQNYQHYQHNQQHHFLQYLKMSIDTMKEEINQIRMMQQIESNNFIIANQFIDKSIKELMKMKTDIQIINDKIDRKFKEFDNRINYAFTKIDKITQNNNNSNQMNPFMNTSIFSRPHIIKNPQRDIKQTRRHKHKINENCDEDEDENDNNQNNNKIIKITSHQPNMQLFPILSHIFGNQQENKSKNELLDSEDEYDDNINVYDDLYALDEEEDDKIITINDEIKSIDDLIKIGNKYKEEQTEQTKQTEQTEQTKQTKQTEQTEKTKKKKITKDISDEIFKKIFGSSKDNVNNIIGPIGTIKIKKIGEEDVTTESETETENENNTKQNIEHNNDNQKNNKDNKDKDIKIIKKYYEYCDKKYNIDIEKIVNLIEPLKKLKNLIGMEKVKVQILDMILYYIQGFENSTSDMLHTSIEGPPGVGKTKLGRILAHIYSALGVIPSKRFKRVKRTDLIGKYLGHTAHKTQEVIDEAEGGVLFIDEAYSLGDNDGKDSFSKECIDTINQNLTEKKKNLIVIVAGYSNQLDQTFFAVNEGLRRRFPFRFQIDGYDEKEMTDIFYSKIKKMNWRLDKSLSRDYLEIFFKQNKDKLKNYGGDIETLVMNCKMTHAGRVIGTSYKNKKILNKDDLDNAYKKYNDNKKKVELSDHIKMFYS